MKKQLKTIYLYDSKGWVVSIAKDKLKNGVLGTCNQTERVINIHISGDYDTDINTLIHELMHAIHFELNLWSNRSYLDIKDYDKSNEYFVENTTHMLMNGLKQLGYDIINKKDGNK